MIQRISIFIDTHERWFRMPLVFFMVSLAVIFTYTQPYILEKLELNTLDDRFNLRGSIPHDQRVIVVAVDDSSLTEIGRWPWSRDLLSTLIERVLGEYHAKVLTLDIIFSEPQLNPLYETLRLLKEAKYNDANVTDWLEKHQSLGDIDGQLEATFKKYHQQLIPGYFFYPMDADVPDEARARLSGYLKDMGNSIIGAQFTPDANTFIPRVAAIEANLPRLTRSTDLVGFFNFFPDTDGVVRRVPLLVKAEDEIYPSMDLQGLRVFLDFPEMSVNINSGGVQKITLGDHKISTNAAGSMLLNHYGKRFTFTHIPAVDVLKGRVDPAIFKNAYVILGATAVGVYDYRPSPFDADFPGVEGHAAAVSNILNDEAIARPEIMDVLELIIVLVLGLLCGRLVIHSGVYVHIFLIFIVPLLLYGIAFWLFAFLGVWLKVTYLIMAVLMATLPSSMMRYIVESHKRAFIHDAFSRYLAPEAVANLIENPEMLALGGEERHMTAFFSDIASFSTFSEKMSPQELVAFLNEYLTAMSDIIMALGGTIDKYEGDAIIAFFGAPVTLENHAKNSVLAAIAQQQELDRLRSIWVARGYPSISVRMGLDSGPMVVGNMGTGQHMNYTIMGDHVNLAARLEGVSKVYRTRTLISGNTHGMVKDDIFCRFVDSARVVGRSTPVDIFEPVDAHINTIDQTVAYDQQYTQAWQLMKQQQFDEAIRILTIIRDEQPNDGLYEAMLVRIQGYINTPPPKDWDGVFNLTSK